MLEQVESADFVLVICTDPYRNRFEGRAAEGGAGVRWEGAAQFIRMEFEERSRLQERLC